MAGNRLKRSIADEDYIVDLAGKGSQSRPVSPSFGKLVPDTCHGDTSRLSMESQRTWPGGTDETCGPRSHYKGEQSIRRAKSSEYNGQSSIAGLLRAYASMEMKLFAWAYKSNSLPFLRGPLCGYMSEARICVENDRPYAGFGSAVYHVKLTSNASCREFTLWRFLSMDRAYL